MRIIWAYLKHFVAITILVAADPSKADECSDEEVDWWDQFMGRDAAILEARWRGED